MHLDHIDRRRVFVTGLSAGGAMTAAMLATAPALFAGGAIIAGLPYGSAASVQGAIAQMHHPHPRPAREWGDRVRAAARHDGTWPAIQIWHGDADTMVVPANADALVAQWTDVLGLPPGPTSITQDDGARHEVWRTRDGRPALEQWRLPGFGHGTPVATAGTDADQTAGIPGPHMLAAPISATWHLARSWALLTQPPRPQSAPSRPHPTPTIVERALKAAGLTK